MGKETFHAQHRPSWPHQIFFYSREDGEPPHVHMWRDRDKAKVWLIPVAIAIWKGFADRELAAILRIIGKNRTRYLDDGMATSARLRDPPIPTDVRCESGRLVIDLDDGRTIALPLEWYPRLNELSDEERRTWELIAGGEGIHWPDIDEHLSVEQLILGIKAPSGGIWPGEPRKSERT